MANEELIMEITMIKTVITTVMMKITAIMMIMKIKIGNRIKI